MALPSRLLAYVGGRHFQWHGPSPLLRSLGPYHQWRHKSQGYSGIPFVPMVFWVLLIERCMTMSVLLLNNHSQLKTELNWRPNIVGLYSKKLVSCTISTYIHSWFYAWHYNCEPIFWSISFTMWSCKVARWNLCLDRLK